MPLLVAELLGSSHAPPAGTVVAEVASTYSETWHRWEPVKLAAQAAWAPARPLVKAPV